ncbi:PP2C family protein-serine/threonine phosphatase [Streptomyces sp. NEAU-S7GS2]|uniref:PP2C family protein-serine/threonine phosphatase n=1 Tax=Streptomyces sp. NEAU-S7GS2 TaxID=2202000 RepID=UPI000D6F9039|nr:PP2C family protein-serine/threonine phosphatase [Streptomyces sp. NEAU-S7GS2]AWN30131.1 serine/threonine protein phosphatase [Streptomyces sp. NEAU-S7GS2]
MVKSSGVSAATATATASVAGVDVGAAWQSAPHPVLVISPSGVVRAVNDAAAPLFPAMRAGAPFDDAPARWLADAHQRFTDPLRSDDGDPARGPVGDRSFEARPSRAENGDVVWWLVDDTARRSAEDALRAERERTGFLAQASTELLASLNAGRCMDVTARLAAQYLADAAVVVTPPSGRRWTVSFCGPDGQVVRDKAVADPASVPGLAEALRGFPPVPSRWIDPAAVPDWVKPSVLGDIGSVVVTPLPGHGVAAGALILMRRSGHAAFDESEETFARLFAARAGAAMSAARLYAEQAAITRTLMRELLPPRLEQVSGVEFAGGYRASNDTDRVGGDFYDVHAGAGPDEESLVVLGDVCGKGLEAAVQTGKIRNTLHALLPLATDHQRVLRLLNGALLDSDHTRFATLVLASVARRGGTVRLRVTSAGHPAPLVVRVDGRVEEADTRGSLVGALPEVTSRTASLDLAPGESCLLYTDGITEAMGGPMGEELFGEERLRSALSECAGLPAEAVVERIRMLAAQWVGTGRHDDMAVVAITAPHHAHLSAVDGHTRGRYTA